MRKRNGMDIIIFANKIADNLCNDSVNLPK